MTTVKTVTYGRGFTHTLEQPIFTGIFEGQRRVPLPAISADITGMMEYLIKVRWDGAKSKFILTGENGQEAEFEPQPKGFYKDVKWYVQNYSDSETFFIERALDVEARIESHCEDIWTALTSKNFLDHRFLSNHKITATIYIDEDLQSPPPKDFSFGILWELLELKQTAKMVHPVCRVVRIAASQSPRKPAVAIGPGGENVHKRHLRILFVVARELNNKSEIDPELILKALFQMKKSLPIGGISLEILRPGTFNALKAQLEDASKKQVPFDMVHFDVHGEISEKVPLLKFSCSDPSNIGKLCMVQAKDVSDLLNSHGVKAVVLNACQSAAPVANLARTFVEYGIPLVLASPWDLRFESAETMMIGFYHHFLYLQMDFISAVSSAREGLGRGSRIGGNGTTVKVLDSFALVLYANSKTANLSLKYASQWALTQPPLFSAKWTSKRPYMDTFFVGDEPQLIGRNLDILDFETQLCLAGPVLRLYGLRGVGKSAFLQYAEKWWVYTDFVESSWKLDFADGDHSFHDVLGRLGVDKADSISTSDGDAEARCRLALHEILIEQRVLLILDSFECSQSQSVWVEFLESLQQSKRCRSFCILAHCSMLETIRGGVAGESAGQSNILKSSLLPTLTTTAAEELVRNLAAKYDVVLDEDSDSASLEELTLLLGCIPSAIESFIKSYAAHEKALDAADACRQLLNSSFNMSFWEQSGMASSSVLLKIFQHIGTSPPELGLLALLLGQFSKRIPLDPALLMACLELCGSKPESSYSGITQDSPGRIRELNSEIQTLTADNTIRYADLGIQYAEFISLLLSHGLLQFDDPQFHHLLPQENMRKSDILFGKWIYIHPLLTDILRDRARHSDFDCIRDRIQRSFILYREVLLMRHRDSRFKRLFVSENLLNFISYPSMPLGSISAPPVTTLARVSAYTMRYITSLLEFQADSLSTSEPETIRLHSAMIPLIMQGICEDFTSWHTLWVEEHSHNPLQQRIARTFQQRIAVIATVETALGLCSIYARDRNWPRLIQLAASADDTIRKINQPPGEDLNSLSSKVDEFLYLENKASLVLSGPYQEIKIYSEEVFDLNSTFLKVRSQIDGMDLKMSSRDMQEDFLFRSRKLVAKPIHIQAEIQVKQKIIQDIESKTWDLAWVLKWRTELAIILCKEKNYWEALDQLVHLQVVIMKFRLVAYCQPSRVNACFVDQIAFVFYLYGHIAMSLCGTQNKQFAQYMFSACAQLCIGGYSWTQRVLRLSCLDIICTSGCATEKPLWKECIGFLDLFYSKSTSARRLGARNLDGSRGYGEDFDEAEDYVLFGHKPRHAVYFLERRLFTRYEGKYSTIDLNDGDYVTGLRAGLFFKIIFMSVGGVDYQVEKKDSLFGVLAQDHPAKHYLEKVLELDKDQLCEYLCIISCFVLATLLVNSSKDVKDNEVEISTFIAEAEVVMFGNEEFLDEYYSRRLLDDSIVLHFKNTREGKYGLQMAARTRNIEDYGKTLLSTVWETEFWQGIKGSLLEIAGVDPTSKEADLVSTSAVLGFFNRIPVVKLEGPAEQALEIFKIEQAVSMDDSSVSSDDSSSSSDDPSFEWAYQHARRLF